MEFHYVDLRCFCYETEEDERVGSALRWYLPEDAEVERETSEGHYGDTIDVLSARVENADQVRAVFDRVTAAPGFATVLADLEERVDEDCAFHLRLDKQAAYGGEAELGKGIQLTAKVEAYPAEKEKAVAAVRRSFEGDG
jgi:hypothetical protein